MYIMKLVTLLVSLLLLLSGCVTSHKMNHLSVGMPKHAVLSALGRPNSTASPGGGVEILRYNLLTDSGDGWGRAEEFFVRLVDGNVESYGRMGDFSSTQDPTLNLNINQ